MHVKFVVVDLIHSFIFLRNIFIYQVNRSMCSFPKVQAICACSPNECPNVSNSFSATTNAKQQVAV
jgi:hypothetical protein